MKPFSISKGGLRYVIHYYRGHVIESFDISQLGDEECKGKAFSVYPNLEAHQEGSDPLNATYRIDFLREAKSFVDDLLDQGPLKG